jgi:hypothetical protein
LTGDAIDQAVRGANFGDIRPAVIDALDRIGMTYDQFMEDKRGERPQIGVAGEACLCTVRQSRPTASSNPRDQA